jgi:hypothetical protein
MSGIERCVGNFQKISQPRKKYSKRVYNYSSSEVKTFKLDRSYRAQINFTRIIILLLTWAIAGFTLGFLIGLLGPILSL